MKFLVISKKNLWTNHLINNLSESNLNFTYSSECSVELFKKVKPSWAFFFHWSDIVEPEIYKNYKCIVIHTGNLPKDRGGSPLQNQILNGTNFSKVNAIDMSEPVDSGSIYCSKSISLQGSIVDIWLSIADAAADLIKECVQSNPSPISQKGQPKTFKRVKNNLLDLDVSKSINYIYDQIRMVDSTEYPNCHLKKNGFKFDFSRASIDDNSIIADVRITKE